MSSANYFSQKATGIKKIRTISHKRKLHLQTEPMYIKYILHNPNGHAGFSTMFENYQ